MIEYITTCTSFHYGVFCIAYTFSVKLIHLSPKTANILHPFTSPFYTITETPDFCVKVYFCLIVRFYPLSPSYQRHSKTKKLGSTTHRDEPHQTSKSLDFKPFFHTFACEYPNSYLPKPYSLDPLCHIASPN